MFSKILRSFLIFCIAGGMFSLTALTVFAEGDGLCTGMVMGTTIKENENAGQTYFDSHGGPANITDLPVDKQNKYGQVVDLSIIGLNPGLAPADREQAACAESESGTYNDAETGDMLYEYGLQGYAWNDNLGFISFYCNAGQNAGIACGNFDYGVKVGTEVNGKRDLFGYAWNSIFGYIKFKGEYAGGVNESGPFVANAAGIDINVDGNNYNVKVVNTWEDFPLQGANIIVNGVNYNNLAIGDTFGIGNATFEIKAIPAPFPIVMFTVSVPAGNATYGVQMDPNGNLSGYAWTQAGVWMNFSGAQIELPGQNVVIPEGTGVCNILPKPYACIEVVPEASGNEYKLNLYLRKEDGVTPLDIDDYNISLNFIWEDTVKINQLAYSNSPADLSLNTNSTPWKSGKGGVLYKPISIADTASLKNSFTKVVGEDGHYVMNKSIKSYAPTSNENVSMTTSTLPPILFSNEFFVDKLALNNVVWSDSIEENNLTLKSISYNISPKAGGNVEAGVIYPNGKGNGYKFKFESLVSLTTLYASGNEDKIIGFRNLPMSFMVGATKAEEADNVTSKEEIYLALDYDKIAVAEAEACAETPQEYKNFDYHFLNVAGVQIAVNYANSQWTFNGSNESFVHAVKYTLNQLKGDPIQINAVATLPSYDSDLSAQENIAEGQAEPLPLPCDIVKGPTLYSVIKYQATYDGKTRNVYYYGNKLPRLISEAFNPSAVVHGNIYASDAFSTTASHTTQSTGYVAIDVFRNTINENIKKQLGDIDKGSGKCTITELNEDGIVSDDCLGGGDYEVFEVDDENVIYFNNTEVTLDLDKEADGDSKFAGKWALVIQDAPLYIDNDLYHVDINDGSLAIAVIKSYEGDCADDNIYLHADVKNVDANIVSDCSLYSYHPDVGIDNITGIPDWTYQEMTEKLNKQKFFRGSLATRNTLGGADLDSLMGAKYLKIGTGEVFELPVTDEQRLRAQIDDLNYFAFFRLNVQTAANGLPIDQSCQKALTIDEMVQIQNAVMGLADPVIGENGNFCDGIDVTIPYDPNSGVGDLVTDVDESLLAEGLDHEKDFAPLYIKQYDSDSFIFKKAGGITTK